MIRQPSTSNELSSTRSAIMRRSVAVIGRNKTTLAEIAGPDDIFTVRISKREALRVIREANAQLEARTIAPGITVVASYIGYYEQ